MKDWGKSELATIGAVVVALLIGGVLMWRPISGASSRADPDNRSQVARGHAVYETHCASCHGGNLEGQPNWEVRKAGGKLPAPPHDATGHTWHHPDNQLFAIAKRGVAAFAPAGYQTDMPSFGHTLTDDDIWAVLAYIKSTWPPEIRARQQRINEQTRQ